jgi:hypothetical protein
MEPLYLGILALLASGYILATLWILFKVIPGIHEELDRQGLDDMQKQRLLVRAVFPPRFHK